MKGSVFANLITIARKERGISQTEACELICIGDPATLSKWETGAVVPSEEMVIKLMESYEEPIIGYIYLQECTKLGQRLLPPVLLSELDNLALNFQYEFEDVKEMRRDIFIGYIYLQECTKLGQRLLPPVLLSELDNLALNFQYEFEDVKEMRRDILEIARDGVVDEEEKPRWLQIQRHSKGLFCTLLPMMIRNFDKIKGPYKVAPLKELTKINR